MADTTYSGWTNYQTWCVALWAGQDSDTWNDMIDEMRDQHDDIDELQSAVATTLEMRSDEMRDDLVGEQHGVLVDLLSNALCHVNWREVAEHMIAG